MDMQSILKKSEETKAMVASVKEKEAVDNQKRLEGIMNAVANKAMKIAEDGKIAPEWMKNEAAQLEQDIITFIREGEGQPLFEYIEKGCAVFFGPTGNEALAVRDFGTYKLSLEKNIEGAKYPKTLKIHVRANGRLANLLSKRLGVESVSYFGVNEILKAEVDGKLSIDYAATDEIPKDTEVIELAKTTTIIGEKTEIEVDIVAAVIDQKVLITRTDWFEDCGKVPKNAGFVFDLRLVRNR